MKNKDDCMQNNSLYLLLKQEAIDENYTVEQADALTKEQIEIIVNDSITTGFYLNIKATLIQYLIDCDNEDERSSINDQLTSGGWLAANFPDAVVVDGCEGVKRFVRVWLNGEPPEDD